VPRAETTSKGDNGALCRQEGLQGFQLECCPVSLFGYAIKDGAQKDVVKPPHVLLNLLEGMEGSGRGVQGVNRDR